METSRYTQKTHRLYQLLYLLQHIRESCIAQMRGLMTKLPVATGLNLHSKCWHVKASLMALQALFKLLGVYFICKYARESDKL